MRAYMGLHSVVGRHKERCWIDIHLALLFRRRRPSRDAVVCLVAATASSFAVHVQFLTLGRKRIICSDVMLLPLNVQLLSAQG